MKDAIQDPSKVFTVKDVVGNYTANEVYSKTFFNMGDAHSFSFSVSQDMTSTNAAPLLAITSKNSNSYDYVIYRSYVDEGGNKLHEIVTQGSINENESIGSDLIYKEGDYQIVMYNGSSTPKININFSQGLTSSITHNIVNTYLSEFTSDIGNASDLTGRTKEIPFVVEAEANQYGVIELKSIDVYGVSKTKWTLSQADSSNKPVILVQGEVKDGSDLIIPNLKDGNYILTFDNSIQVLSAVSKTANQYDYAIVEDEGTYTQAKGVLLSNDKYDVRTVKLQIEVNGEMQTVKTVPLANTDDVTTVKGDFG